MLAEEATLLYVRSVCFVLGSVLLPQQMLKTLVSKLVITRYDICHPAFGCTCEDLFYTYTKVSIIDNHCQTIISHVCGNTKCLINKVCLIVYKLRVWFIKYDVSTF